MNKVLNIMEIKERYTKEPPEKEKYHNISERFNFTFSEPLEYRVERVWFENPTCLLTYNKPRLVTIVYDENIVVLTNI